MKPNIPTLAKVILWLSLLAGGWNAIIGGVFLSSPPQQNSLLDVDGMKNVLILSSLLGLYFLIVSISALQRKEAGRKGYLVGLVLMILGTLAWYGYNVASAPKPLIIIIVGAVGMVIPIGLLVILYRYFSSQTVREAYQAEPTTCTQDYKN